MYHPTIWWYLVSILKVITFEKKRTWEIQDFLSTATERTSSWMQECLTSALHLLQACNYQAVPGHLGSGNFCFQGQKTQGKKKKHINLICSLQCNVFHNTFTRLNPAYSGCRTKSV
jgi:hypothetical protein